MQIFEIPFQDFRFYYLVQFTCNFYLKFLLTSFDCIIFMYSIYLKYTVDLFTKIVDEKVSEN